VFIPPIPLPTTTIGALPINSTRLLIDIPYQAKPPQLSKLAIGGQVTLSGLPSVQSLRYVANFDSFNASLVTPRAEPYPLSTGFKARAYDDTGAWLDLPLTSVSINSSLNGTERVTETNPRIILTEGVMLVNNSPVFYSGTTNSYDVNVYNLVKEQINAYTPYSADVAAWLGGATGLHIDIIKTVAMSDGTVVESVGNSMLTNINVSYDKGVHSATITIRGDNQYRHPTWYSLEYAVDFDISSSYGVVTQKAPHVINYSAGADEPILANAYNLDGSAVRVQALAAPSQLGVHAIVDGIKIQVESIAESHTESASSVSFTGSIV